MLQVREEVDVAGAPDECQPPSKLHQADPNQRHSGLVVCLPVHLQH